MAGIRRLIFEFCQVRRTNESPSSFGIARSAIRMSGTLSCSTTVHPSAADAATQTRAWSEWR